MLNPPLPVVEVAYRVVSGVGHVDPVGGVLALSHGSTKLKSCLSRLSLDVLEVLAPTVVPYSVPLLYTARPQC